MKILFVNSKYRDLLPSGENLVSEEQVRVLRSAGHEVVEFSRQTGANAVDRTRASIATSIAVATGYGPGPKMVDLATQFDVVLVGNLFPNLGSRWMRDLAIPVFSFLHNFRPVCAKGTLFRDGTICLECVSVSSLRAIRYGCYKDSRIATLPIFVRNSLGLMKNDQVRYSKRLIVTSERAHNFYLEQGISHNKLSLIRNFVEDGPIDYLVSRTDPLSRWLCTSRFTEEKGVLELVRAWPSEVPLDLVGAGPLEMKIRREAKRGTSVLGRRDQRWIRENLPNYVGLVFPSLCWENFGRSVAEALCSGVPVLAASGSAGAELVSSSGGGFVYDPLQPVSVLEGIRRIESNRQTMATHGRTYAVTALSVSRWLGEIEGLLGDAVGI